MSFRQVIYFACALVASAGWCVDEVKSPSVTNDPGFVRYKTITDRMPFGREPANFNPDTPGKSGGGADAAAAEAAKNEEEQKIIASVRISALNVTPSGKVAVGFTDSSKQPVGMYYLKVGESRDGWTVKSADAQEMKVTLEKDGIEATLSLGQSSDGGGKPGNGRGGSRLQGGVAGGNASAATRENKLSALRTRRRLLQREEIDRREAAAEQARLEREAERQQREAEREADRQQREADRQEMLKQIQETLRQQRNANAEQQQQGGQPQE